MWPLPASDSGHLIELLNGTDSVRLSGTARLAGADVDRVAPTIGRHDVGERGTVPFRIQLHAISNCRPIFGGIDKNSSYSARGDVDDVIDGPATVREPSRIASEEAQALLAANCGWRNSRVEAEQIRDWAGIASTATRADRWLVLRQDQQIRTRWRGDRNSE